MNVLSNKQLLMDFLGLGFLGGAGDELWLVIGGGVEKAG
jgi:hypothetical protein